MHVDCSKGPTSLVPRPCGYEAKGPHPVTYVLHGSRGYLQSTCEILDSDLQHQKTNNTVLCILLIPKTNQVKLLYGNSLSLRVQSEDKGWLLLHNLPWLPYCSYTSPIVNINKYCMVPWGVNFRITKSKAKLENKL